MSVTINGRSIAVPESGLIFHSVDLVLYDADRQTPANGQAVMMLMQDSEGEIYWEHGEHQDGNAYGPRGWYFIGDSRPLDQTDYRVLLWCHEPPVPDLKALQWGADEAA